MSDENNKSRIRSAMSAKSSYSASSQNLQISYNEEKLREENRYRVEGQAFPDKINCFNWGACILTPIWGLFNNSPIACLILVLGIIPYIGGLLAIGFSIYCGVKGNEWAWANKQWRDMNHFHSVQRKWAIWGVAIEVSILIFAILSTGVIIQWVNSRI